MVSFFFCEGIGMLRFYDVDYDYIRYLKSIEPKVPNIVYNGNSI